MPTSLLLLCSLTSFVLAAAIVLTAPVHGRFTMDTTQGIQKIHLQPTSRVGGICIYLAVAAITMYVHDSAARAILVTVLTAGIPALLAGLLEDLTKAVAVGTRLAATLSSGLLACWIGGITITHTGISPLDGLLTLAPLALAFTAFAVAGVANSINMIDGFHGLASGTATLCLLAIAAIAAAVGDTELLLATLVIAAATTGFWLVNFPWGKLFLGDGGAYFAGFALAWLAVLLPMRNTDVSPWASLLVCAYPIIEVFYSVVRRSYCQASASQADCAHLHSLVGARIVKLHLPMLDPTLQNATVSMAMWVCAAIPALLAVTSYAHTPRLIGGALASLLLYHCLYRWVASK